MAQPPHKKTDQQIQRLLEEKAARTAVQRKIDSQLLQAIREQEGKQMADSTELAPIKLTIDNNGNIQVDIDAQVSDTLLHNIKALGGHILFPSKQYHTVRASVPLQKVETIAAYPAVTFIKFAVQASTNSGVPSAIIKPPAL